MPTTSAILADPQWLPHRYDVQGDRVEFVRLDRETIRGLTFLADHKSAGSDDSQWLPAAAINVSKIPPARLHFIFHTAFVRSTLLTKAFDMPGISFGLSEPAILNDLASAGERGRPLLAPVLKLLARPFGVDEVVVVKPSNVANGLIPNILAASPDTRAVLLSGSVESFLRSVHKKGMMGRRWARRLYLHVMQYAPLDIGMSESDRFEATDLQYAGLVWLLQQRQFAQLLSLDKAGQLRSLNSDRFNDERAATLSKLTEFFGLDASAERVQAVVDGPLFSTHAKLGGDFNARNEAEGQAAESKIVEDEIAMVAQWVGQIAQQAGVAWPMAREL